MRLASEGGLQLVSGGRFTGRSRYELTGVVRGVLASFGVQPSESDFGAAAKALIAVPVESAVEIESALCEAAHGRIEISPE